MVGWRVLQTGSAVGAMLDSDGTSDQCFAPRSHAYHGNESELLNVQSEQEVLVLLALSVLLILPLLDGRLEVLDDGLLLIELLQIAFVGLCRRRHLTQV